MAYPQEVDTVSVEQEKHDNTDRYINGLDFVWLEITQKCNLTCIHCYAESSPQRPLKGEMKLDDWLKVITEASELGCKSLQFIGGEVTLHPHLPVMIEFASQKGFKFIEIFTNATILDQSLINLFSKYNIHVATSFYSARAEIHDCITQHKGSFYKTMHGITQILEAGLDLRIGMTILEQNRDQIEETSSFLKSLGIKNIGTDHLRHVGRMENSYKSNLESQELCGHCWKGRLCVTYNGIVYPCVFARNTIVGNVMKANLSDIVSSHELKAFRIDTKSKQEVNEMKCDPSKCYPACDPGKCYPACDPSKCYPACDPSKCYPACDPGKCYPA